ncbi:MAG: hypothetical protein ABSH48_08985 [Verrucomicrobiota bacterium]|jgi:hypothetical protein
MKVIGVIFAAAAAVSLSATAWSQDAKATADAAAAAAPSLAPGGDAPYAGIVARNMFRLVPIPPPDPHAGEPLIDPPPRITPTGIMTIFGRDQALFTAAPKAKAGQPAKDDAYVLAEGERQDDIEVVKINHEAGLITFNNHGTIEELPLVEVKDGGAAKPGSEGGPAVGGRRQGIYSRFGRGTNAGNAGISSSVRNPGDKGSNADGGNAWSSGTNIEDQVLLGAARQMALIEQARLATQEQVDQGALPPLPPTPLTPDAALNSGGGGGRPLVTGPPLTGK